MDLSLCCSLSSSPFHKIVSFFSGQKEWCCLGLGNVHQWHSDMTAPALINQVLKELLHSVGHREEAAVQRNDRATEQASVLEEEEAGFSSEVMISHLS